MSTHTLTQLNQTDAEEENQQENTGGSNEEKTNPSDTANPKEEQQENENTFNTKAIDMFHECIVGLHKGLRSLFIALTPKQRKNLLKLGKGRMPFVEKTLNYAVHNPEFKLPSMNTVQMTNQLTVLKRLQTSQGAIRQLARELDNTILWLGKDVYSGALSYYQSVKYEARRNQPHAEMIYKDLKQFFTVNSEAEDEDANPVDADDQV